jgi:hypothetical protein
MATVKTPKSPAPAKAAAPVAKSAGAAAAPTPESEIAATPVVVEAAASAPEPKAAAKAEPKAVVPAIPSFDSVVEPVLAGFEDLMAEAKANADAMVKASNHLATGLQKMAHELLEFSQDRLEKGIATGKALSGSASVQDFIDLSQSAAKDGLDKMLDQGSKIRTFSTKLVEDSFAPLQKRVTAVVEKFTHHNAA